MGHILQVIGRPNKPENPFQTVISQISLSIRVYPNLSESIRVYLSLSESIRVYPSQCESTYPSLCESTYPSLSESLLVYIIRFKRIQANYSRFKPIQADLNRFITITKNPLKSGLIPRKVVKSLEKWLEKKPLLRSRKQDLRDQKNT